MVTVRLDRGGRDSAEVASHRDKPGGNVVGESVQIVTNGGEIMGGISTSRVTVWLFLALLLVAAYLFRTSIPEDDFPAGIQLNASGLTTRGMLVSGEAAEGADNISVKVHGVGVHPETGSAVVFLVTEDEDAYIPIFVGHFEASAISRSLEGVRTPRPLTHDLLSDVIDLLGGRMESVVVTSLEGGTFRALIAFEKADGEMGYLDARPSDSIAVALLRGADILVAASVMETAGYRTDEGEELPEAPSEPEAPSGPRPPSGGDLI